MLFNHVLRNAMIPILTNIGLALPGIFVGSFLIEVFFSIPGLGREVLLAVNRSDYPGHPGGDDLPGGADDADQPADRHRVQAGRPAGGAEMSAVLGDTTVLVQASEGVWHAAWRRLRTDRVGMVCGAIVAAFLLLIVLSATGLVAGNWQREVGVPNAPPTFVGPRPAEATGAIEVPKGPNVDLSAVDPLAPRYKEWDERAAKFRTVEIEKLQTLPMGADRLGRDVLAKAIKGTEISIFVGVLAAVVATLIGTVLGAFAGFFGGRVGDVLEWLYNVFTSIPGILLIFAFAAVFGRGIGTVVLILGLTGWTGIYRLVRAEFMKHAVREYVRAAEAIGASAAQPHVPPHPAQRQPRDPGAAVDPDGGLHQGRGDPVLPGPGRAGRPGQLGHDAGRGAERADPRPLVAAGRGDALHGGLRHRVLADDRRAARCARPETAGAGVSAARPSEGDQRPLGGPARRALGAT